MSSWRTEIAIMAWIFLRLEQTLFDRCSQVLLIRRLILITSSNRTSKQDSTAEKAFWQFLVGSSLLFNKCSFFTNVASFKEKLHGFPTVINVITKKHNFKRNNVPFETILHPPNYPSTHLSIPSFITAVMCQ